ncbi:MAG: hypothetical protein R2751_07095 [Bacteroidales bacterium]
MRSTRVSIPLIGVLFCIPSCILEDNVSIDYHVRNLCSEGVWMCWYEGQQHGIPWTDSVYLMPEEDFHTSYYDMGGWNNTPFGIPDSMVLRTQSGSEVTYSNAFEGRSPLHLDHYTGGKTGEHRNTTYFKYTYEIREEDFEVGK